MIKLEQVLHSEHFDLHEARDRILLRVRSAIVNGSLPTGTRIPQQRLAAIYGVSRMPIREVLRKLEAQGYVSSTVHKGVVVSSHTLWGAPPSITVEMVEAAIAEAHQQGLLAPRTDANDVGVRVAMLAVLTSALQSRGNMLA